MAQSKEDPRFYRRNDKLVVREQVDKYLARLEASRQPKRPSDSARRRGLVTS